MRIVAGTNKGMVLKTAKGSRIRPTADRVKEALFSILGVKIIDAKVLDLFSGTGNLGLEALSRSAFSAWLVDNHPESIALINANVVKTKSSKAVRVLKSDCVAAIQRLALGLEKFDIIFCDPPYNSGWLEVIIDKVGKYKLLSTDGLLIIEHHVDEKYVPTSGLKLVQSRRYGATLISFFAEEANANSSMSREF